MNWMRLAKRGTEVLIKMRPNLRWTVFLDLVKLFPSSIMKTSNRIPFLLFGLACLQMTLFGQESKDPLIYKKQGEIMMVVDCDSAVSGKVVIPKMYQGRRVIGIGKSAFSRCRNLTEVVIPEGVTYIGS